jgi:hypothetical protein
MNPPDLHVLLTAPTISRADFFAQLPAEPATQHEPTPDDLPTSNAAELSVLAFAARQIQYSF